MTQLESEPVARFDASAHRVRELPVLVLMPHSRCNCRCVMCDIWRIRQVREITVADLAPHLASLRELKVKWVVFSGGEPLLHSDLWSLADVLHREGIKTTLLTAGLTLARHAARVADHLDDVIVSLDGPQPVHNQIRGVPDAYRRLERGIQALRQHRVSMAVHGRCTVQKRNYRHLPATVGSARHLALNSISFLAADTSPRAFNHDGNPSANALYDINLSVEDLAVLTEEIEGFIAVCRSEFASGFIRESPEKLRRIVAHFRAELGQAVPVAPRCNAPWVSAVVESDGAVRPCFFHPPFGSMKDGTLADVLNSDAALRFRSGLDVSQNSICQRCVCSLLLTQTSPLGLT